MKIDDMKDYRWRDPRDDLGWRRGWMTDRLVSSRPWKVKRESLSVKERPLVPFRGAVLKDGDMEIVLRKYFVPDKPPRREGDWIPVDDSYLESLPMVGIIKVGGVEVGNVDEFRHDGGETTLGSIYIHDRHRRNGYGKRCIMLLVDEAIKNGSEVFVIDDILTGNDGAEYVKNVEVFEKIIKDCIAVGKVTSLEIDDRLENGRKRITARLAGT